MKVTRRQMMLLQFLSENTICSISTISSWLSVSPQTIKSDLANLEPLMEEFQIHVEIKSGKEIRVLGSKNLIRLMKNSENLLEFSYENQTLLLLLLHHDFLVLQDVADALFISKSSVEKLMPVLMNKQKNKIQSVRHYGIRYAGSEIERCLLFTKLLEPYLTGVDFLEELKNFHQLHFPIFLYFSEEQIKKAVEFLEEIAQIGKIYLTDEALRQIFLQIIFLIRNNEEKEKEPLGDSFRNTLDEIPNKEWCLAMVAQLNETLKMGCDVQEINYLSYLLLSARKQKNVPVQTVVEDMAQLIDRIFEEIRNRFQIDLSEEEDLREKLTYHIFTAVLRRNHALDFDGGYSGKKIKQQYPLGFEMAAIAVSIIEEEYHYKISEKEIIYLTLHFQAVNEKRAAREQKIKASIVCHYGMAAANLIAEKVSRRFSEIEVEGIFSLQEFKRKKEEVKSSLILTTENIPDVKIPVIYVTPVLSDQEIQTIGDFIKKKTAGKKLSRYIEEAIVLKLPGGNTPEDIIIYLGNQLQKKGFVEKEYIRSVLNRENISHTNLKYVAVPHGNPDYVIRTGLAIGLLDKPVLWGESKIECVFLLTFGGSKKAEDASVFSYFYRTLAHNRVEEQIRSMKDLDPEEFRKNLKNILIGG